MLWRDLCKDCISRSKNANHVLLCRYGSLRQKKRKMAGHTRLTHLFLGVAARSSLAQIYADFSPHLTDHLYYLQRNPFPFNSLSILSSSLLHRFSSPTLFCSKVGNSVISAFASFLLRSALRFFLGRTLYTYSFASCKALDSIAWLCSSCRRKAPLVARVRSWSL